MSLLLTASMPEIMPFPRQVPITLKYQVIGAARKTRNTIHTLKIVAAPDFRISFNKKMPIPPIQTINGSLANTLKLINIADKKTYWYFLVSIHLKKKAIPKIEQHRAIL